MIIFLPAIKSYCEENEAAHDNFRFEDEEFQDNLTQGTRQINNVGLTPKLLSETVMTTYTMFHERCMSLVSSVT